LPEESHSLNPVTPLATILNDVIAATVGRAFFNLHRLPADNATHKVDQRTLIVVQMISLVVDIAVHSIGVGSGC
jgi:hypothetical protein